MFRLNNDAHRQDGNTSRDSRQEGMYDQTLVKTLSFSNSGLTCLQRLTSLSAGAHLSAGVTCLQGSVGSVLLGVQLHT